MQTQPAADVLARLLVELRPPLQTLTSLADLLDLKAAALDSSLRLQTDGFRDTVRHVDWLLSEAVDFANPPQVLLRALDFRPLVLNCVERLARQVRSPLRLEDTATQSCILSGDERLLDRFVTTAIRLAGQLSEPDRRIWLRLGHLPLHGHPALHLDVEASVPHVHARDFAEVGEAESAGPLRGFSFALQNCRRTLDQHHAAVEFTDLPGPLLRLRVFFPILSPEQAAALSTA
jgi:hypothetical protein